MRKTHVRGEITVFLSLTLTCICALMCGLLESVRTAGSGWYLQTALNSSLESLMSKYHRQVWEDYHLFLLEYEDEEGLKKELEPYLSAYLSSDLTYALAEQELQVSPMPLITEQGGKYLEKEILDYMKLGIWSTEQDPGKLDTLVKDIKEADSLEKLTSNFQLDTRQTIKLEEAIETIGESLTKQERHLEEGRKRLKRCDGSGFISEAKKLLKELDKMPGLVERYEKEADKLAESLLRAQELKAAEEENLREDTRLALTHELAGIREYTDREGQRRKEIKDLVRQAEENRSIIEGAIKEAEETEEYIEEWNSRDEEDDDDDDDELDEEALWQAVLHTFNGFKVNRSFSGTGIKDKKTLKLLERISLLAGGDLLSFVVPEDREISSSSLSLLGYPSERYASSGGSRIGGEGAGALLERPLINEYTVYHFTNFLKEDEGELQYEQEYILNGAASDRENLKKTVNDLLKLRGALNLLHLLKDSEKRGEANALALAITGAAGLAPLNKVVTFFILTVWAFGEALEDVKSLLAGGSVPFIKSRQDWQLSLQGLLEIGDSKNMGRTVEEKADSGRGLDYQDYLRLFLLMQKREERNYRIMDMIQKSIRVTQESFAIEKCTAGIQVRCKAQGKHVTLHRTTSKIY